MIEKAWPLQLAKVSVISSGHTLTWGPARESLSRSQRMGPLDLGLSASKGEWNELLFFLHHPALRALLLRWKIEEHL